MAARFLSTFRSFILILGLWTALLQKQDTDCAYNNLSRHERCKWQGFYDLQRIFGHLYYMNFRAAMKRIYANSDSEVSFPAFKATKHGTVTLVLPGRIFSTDLTSTWMSRQIQDQELIESTRVNVTPWKPRSSRSQLNFKSSAAAMNYSRQGWIQDFT